MDQGMLLPILLHLLLDEAVCSIDNLLIQFQFSFLLVEVLLGPSDFDGVEVKELVLLLEYLEQALSLHPLMEDLILDAPSQLDLLLILSLHQLGLLLHLLDLVVEHFDLLPGLLLLLSDSLLDVQVFLSLLCDESIELFDFSLIRFILSVSHSYDLIFFVDLTLCERILLLIDNLSHLLDSLHSLVGCLEPLAIGILQRV